MQRSINKQLINNLYTDFLSLDEDYLKEREIRFGENLFKLLHKSKNTKLNYNVCSIYVLSLKARISVRMNTNFYYNNKL